MRLTAKLTRAKYGAAYDVLHALQFTMSQQSYDAHFDERLIVDELMTALPTPRRDNPKKGQTVSVDWKIYKAFKAVGAGLFTGYVLPMDVAACDFGMTCLNQMFEIMQMDYEALKLHKYSS